MVESDRHPSKPGVLIGYASKILSTFNVKTYSSDAHLQSFLQDQLFHQDDEVFITEVFAGCVKYNPLLKVIVDGYYASDGKACLKSESSLYYVICYLVMFRLDELGMKQFKRLIISQPNGKMLKFLKFFFNESNLSGWIRDEWYATYDRSFVDANIISQIQRHKSQLREFIDDYLVAKDNDTLPPSHDYRIATTEVKPFKITKPKPRRIPTPEEIPKMKTHNLIPESTYIPPRESDTVRINKETLRLRAERKVEEAELTKFSCAKTEKSLKTKNVIKQIIEERETKLEHVKVKPIPFPTSMNQPLPTKLNTAAILREGARVQRAAEDENKRLAKLEAGHKDNTEFEKWQEDMRQIDLVRQQAEIKRKHLESKLCYEDAILSRQNHTQETRQKVCQTKEEYEELMTEYFTRQEEEKKNMRKLIEQVTKGHDNAREAKMKLQQMKQKIVQQVDKESQELMARALEEAERKMKQKVELIQQIRAMESVPVIRNKFVDLTETNGQGLLSEMSVVELRERLSLMKLTNEEEKEKKRKEITAAKEAKDQILTETLEAINEYKSIQHHNDLRKAQQRNNILLQRDHHDKELMELQQKLEAKRKTREKLKHDGSNITLKTNAITKSKVRNEQSTKDTAIETLLRTTSASLKS